MHLQREKMILIELASLGLAIVLGVIAFIKGFKLLILGALLLLVCSSISSGLLYYYTFRHTEAYKQFARALVLFFLTMWISFRI